MEKVYFWCYLMYTDINQCYHVIQGAVEDKMIDKIINQGESVKLAEGKLDNQGITPARKSKVSFIKNKRIENLMSFYVMQANRDKEWMYYITCLLYTSPSPRDLSTSRMPSSA